MITPGTLLIERDAARPSCFQLETGNYSDGWLAVKHNLTPRELESNLAAEGWTFFYMAGPVRAFAFGWDQEARLKLALHRIIGDVRRHRCNCLVINEVSARKFLGIPYVSITARPRHIQIGKTFAGKWHRQAA